ncbi:MAG: hypothetical protein A2600_05220 [Candidatus Lambdaproteobacteria bacterium RIFOXYD1_FULL_56_27]|uniref:Flagellar assembly protein T C-terminal domain-containing protein n=1 Tax=Candidatus Lambdaproteobacteria bacterium RIFOXYD2_FULL_56_26 TaxID=1817773 RepID=A0A1F6GS06_9PROT|nr:MAG: hypothetical protein A2426_08075 [Candidatus Lambdaproteobacteria bacterium RIFOXYC1_FULL_56_13]OGH00781.1 MAG: hypothetical protein A2557_03665 [Candidatus Lambdaproteobacteria bacterium RIFOXYD2_FULL_56_26]OGH09954.1 MAG: hypothetical protein A2600_05220 [Candidatus Lambdaproteobacteria bacterium RIFOXYD1_FULL_56_27]
MKALVFWFGILCFVFGVITAEAQEMPKGTEVLKANLADPETAQTGLLVLQFAATGMTDSAARAYSSMIAQNVGNTNRFLVTDHEQAEQVMMRENPKLLPCFEIGCGIQMAKILGADRILSGNLSLGANNYVLLKVKLVNVLDNSIEFEDEIRFTDETMDRRLYTMAQGIAKNTPLKGKILRANNKLVVVDLGANHGVSVGDRFVIYKNQSISGPETSYLSNSSNSRRANIGILTITKVGDFSSEGVFFQKTENPDVGQYVTTYLEKRKQIQLIDYVRKELDTSMRHVFEIERKVEIRPISLEDIDKNRWITSVRLVEEDRDYWQMWMIGTGLGTGFFLSQFKNGDDLKVMAVIGGFAYSSIQFFKTKSLLKGLVQEGKFKGYLDVTFNPNLPSGKLGVGYHLDF